MSQEKKAYENHYVRPAPDNGYQHDTFVCHNSGGPDEKGWVTTPWLVFNYCPLCGQELEDRQYDPPDDIPSEGI